MDAARIALVAGVLALSSACGSAPSPQSSTGAAPTDSPVAVSGHLEGVGGPAPGAPRAWQGTVSWHGSSSGTVATDSDGAFDLALPPGHYVLTGHSPQYGDGAYLCRAGRPVVVHAGQPLRVDVLCQMK
jgi:hypothetical protein